MKKAILAVVLGGVALGAMAQETPWQVRARAVHINPADKSDPIGGVGPSDLITVSSKTIPEVDISYFFTPNISTELVLTYPQKHDVYVDGQSVGTFKHLPPTLLAQYHFTPSSQVSPYVGVGVNWTTFSRTRSWTARAAWNMTASAWPCRLAWTTSWTRTGRSTWTSRKCRSAATCWLPAPKSARSRLTRCCSAWA